MASERRPDVLRGKTGRESSVHLSRRLGANRRFIEQHIPHLGSPIRGDIESVILESHILVDGLSADVCDALARHACRGQIVLDLAIIPNPAALRAREEGLCW